MKHPEADSLLTQLSLASDLSSCTFWAFSGVCDSTHRLHARGKNVIDVVENVHSSENSLIVTILLSRSRFFSGIILDLLARRKTK